MHNDNEIVQNKHVCSIVTILFELHITSGRVRLKLFEIILFIILRIPYSN